MTLASIKDSVDLAVQRIEVCLRQEQGTVFVAFGEYHGMPSHAASMILVADRLAARGIKTALGFELPCDAIHSGFIVGPHNFAELHGYPGTILTEKDTRILNPLAFMAHAFMPEKQMQIEHALGCGIDVLFNDEDGEARAKAVMVNRNRAMFQMGIEHAAEEGVQVYLQHCGNAHVIGSQAWGLPVAESLTGLFTASVGPNRIVPIIQGASEKYQPIKDDRLLHLFPGEHPVESMEADQRERDTYRFLAEGGLRAGIPDLESRRDHYTRTIRSYLKDCFERQTQNHEVSTTGKLTERRTSRPSHRSVP